MPSIPCLEPGCPHLATRRGRCKEHNRKRDRDTHRNKSFYNSKRWKLTSRKQLFEFPLCKMCLAEGRDRLAVDADHIIPIEDGGDRWDPANLQSLCRKHHGQKTKKEQAIR